MNIEKILSELSLEEKAALVSGSDFWHTRAVDRLGIPSVMMTDGPHGLRKEVESVDAGLLDSVPATCFPTASCLASSWDSELLFEVGKAIAEEALEEGVGILLGPGANIKRSPLCGRNFEYFSEDPVLSGEMASAWVRGAQSMGVGASLKHYAVNNQETLRMSIDALVDERALREIYLAGFEIAVREAQPWTVMAAYNQVNGAFCAEHRYLLEDILRGEWCFQGLVVSDWGAANDRVEGLRAGLDLEMPGVTNGNIEFVIEAVKSGALDENVLDRAVIRVLALAEKAWQSRIDNFRYGRERHHKLARRAAAEGAVLLKNEDHLLPLDPDVRIALIGEFARQPRYQGSGSSFMNPNRLDILQEKLAQPAGNEQVTFASGYSLQDDQIHSELIAEAVSAAGRADVAVVYVGLPDIAEVEGIDRRHLRLPTSHDALVEAVAAACPRTIVVLSNGAPVEMPWESRVPAILEGYLGGQAGALALADVLYGRVNPCGKLAETFPLRLEDNPSFHNFPGGPRTVEYRESIYVGYRFYDKARKDVLFPIGHGLSYTAFQYKDLRLGRDSISAGESLKVGFAIRNSGGRGGAEIAQVYVRDTQSSVFRPEKELKGFARVELDPGEERRVDIELNPRAFAFYSADLSGWVVEAGEFEILVGASSCDIRLRGMVRVDRQDTLMPEADRRGLSQYYKLPENAYFSAEGFQRLYRQALPANQPEERGEYTFSTPVSRMRGSWVGRWLAGYMRRELSKLVQGFEDTPRALMMEKIAVEGPLRIMLMSAGGQINRGMLEGLLMMINGNFLRGLSALLKARKTPPAKKPE